jgi:flagellar hook assembly protein FlgD
LAAEADVTVRVYGLDGAVVRTLELGRRAIGEYRARDEAAYWDGRNESGEQAASGVYIYELQAGAHRSMRRMTVLK